MKYNTAFYQLYDRRNPNPAAPYTGSYGSPAHFNEYPLFRNKGKIDAREIPRSGVGIDDLNCARLAEAYSSKDLANIFPSEFDTNGMIRAKRYPLDDAAKVYVDAGKVDQNGEIAPRSAFYYKWYRGLQLLCGEGVRLFKVRPSYEDKTSALFTWRVGFEAVIQEPEDGISKKRQASSSPPPDDLPEDEVTSES